MIGTSDDVMKGNEYVGGFVFNASRNRVILIQKRKPIFQYGRYNAVGGKIEKDETPYMAMCRECKEETGVHLSNWEEGAVLVGHNWIVFFFYYVFNTDDGFNATDFRTMTSEAIHSVVYPYTGPADKILRNCPLIMSVCLDETIIKPMVIFDKEMEFSNRGKIAKQFNQPIGANDCDSFVNMGQILRALQE